MFLCFVLLKNYINILLHTCRGCNTQKQTVFKAPLVYSNVLLVHLPSFPSLSVDMHILIFRQTVTTIAKTTYLHFFFFTFNSFLFLLNLSKIHTKNELKTKRKDKTKIYILFLLNFPKHVLFPPNILPFCHSAP